MKKSYISILLLLMVMILGISAVSAADIDDASDSDILSVDETAVDEAVSTDAIDEVQTATDDAETLSADGDGNFTELQDSIDSKNMVMMDKDYTRVDGESDISISKDVTILGNDHKIDANNLGGIFNVNPGYTLTLMGVTLINGNAENGGAIYNNGGTLTIVNSYFLDNTATKSGGAIYNNGGSLTVTGSTFDGNDLTDRTQNGWGGAAIYDNAGTVLISTSTISNNLKDIVHRGGTGDYKGDLSSAAVTSTGTLTVSDSTFENNSGSYGGAILSNGANAVLTVSGSTFTNNLAFNGGAIDFTGNTYTITGSTFKGNKARGTGSSNSNYAHGGAIAASETNDDCIISDCIFEDNSAVMGGAISSTNNQIVGCTFTNNIVNSEYSENFNGKVNNRGGYGSAIYSDASITITDSTFTDNPDVRGNGAVYARDAEITGSSFTDSVIYVNRGPLTISDNQYDNDGVDISGGNSPKIYFDGIGDIPNVKSATLYYDASSFADLKALIDSGSTATVILTGDITKLASEEEEFADGILIDRSITIDADGHTITANNGKVFTVTADGSLTLRNANVVGDGTSAIVNNGKVTVSLSYPSTFENVGEYAIDNKGRVTETGLTTFTQLNNLICLVNGGEVYIGSSKITKTDDEKETFKDGIVIENDVTIIGTTTSKGAINTVIDAANDGRIFSINDGADVTLDTLILKNGNAEKGAAVYVEAGNVLAVNKVNFIDNTAVYRGGAIYSEGTVNVANSLFDGNDITFRTKNDDNGGAAVYNKNGVLSIVNSNITNNLKDIVIRNGNAGDLLVGVVVTSGETVIKGSYFANNTGSWGGAISSLGYLNTESYTLTVMDSKFEGNNATFGGAIFVESSKLIVENSTFENNKGVGVGSSGTSNTQGGAIVVFPNGASAEITDSTFIANSANTGGAVSLAGVDTDSIIENCTFTDNTANDGGAVYLWTGGDAAVVTVANSTFSGNTAGWGNAISTDGNLALSNNTISGTSADIGNWNGVIVSAIYINIMNNGTYAYHMQTIKLNATITDDNGNLIIDRSFEFVIGEDSVAAVFHANTGIYEADYVPATAGTFEVNIAYPNSDFIVKTATITISKSLTDLANIISNAEAGSTITLDGDYAYIAEFDEGLENGIVIDKNIIIDGNGSTISGSDVARLFNVAADVEFTLKNATLRDAKADKGAAVYVAKDGLFDADSVNFINNTAVYRGGAIYSEGTVNVANSVFDSNDITFRTKNDDNGGAAIYNKNGVLSVVDSNITNNLKDIVIRNGNAGDLLVGVVVTSGETVIKGSYFANNTGSWGGAISSLGYLNTESYTLTVMDSKFEGNNATFGGAIFVESSNLIVENSTFENNKGVGVGSSGTSNTQGGAIVVQPAESSAKITDSTFIANSANVGGAVSLAGVDQDSIIENCTFTDNTAGDGGAVYLWTQDDAAVTVANSTFSGNTARWGNAISTDGKLALSNNTISGTSADIGNWAGEVISQINIEILENKTVDAVYGETVEITAVVADDNGNLLNDKAIKFTINGGEKIAATYFTDLGKYAADYTPATAGTYVIGVDYPDMDNVVVKTGTIAIEKFNASLAVVAKDIVEGENATIIVTLFGPEETPLNDTVKVVVRDVEYTVDVVNGTGNLTLENLTGGTTYPIFAIFDGDGNYNVVYDSDVLDVKYATVLVPFVEDVYREGEEIVLKFMLFTTDGFDMDAILYVTVGEENYKVFVNEGNGTLNLTGLAVGNYTVAAVYNGDSTFNYTETTYVPKFEVIAKEESIITINPIESVQYGEDVVIEFNMNHETDFDTISITDEEGNTYDREFEDGVITVSDLPAGTYTVTIYTPGDENYTEAEATATFEVEMADAPEFVIDIEAGTYPDDVVITVLSDVDGTATILVVGEDYEEEFTVANGEELTISGLNAGDYDVYVSYDAGSNYEDGEDADDFTIKLATPEFTFEVDTVDYPNDLTITVNSDVAGLVSLVIGDEQYDFEIEAGETVLSVPGLDAGVSAENFIIFSADNYDDVMKQLEFEINKGTPEIDAEITVDQITYPGEVLVTVIGPDGNYNISVDGQVIPVTVVDGSSDVISIKDLSAGAQTLTVEFEGNNNYNASSIDREFNIVKGVPEISASAANVWIGNDATVVVTVPNAVGNVVVTVNGKKYTAELSEGVATATIDADDLAAGENVIDVTFAGDDNYAPNFNSTTMYVLDGVITNATYGYYFESGTLVNIVPEDVTLDFQGLFAGAYTVRINKPVNIISTTEDAVFDSESKSGNSVYSFNVVAGADHTNITGMSFKNYCLYIQGASYVTVDNCSLVANVLGVGSGTGFLSIHSNAYYTTVENCYMENGGTGSSVLVLGKGGKYASFDNNVINITGSSGNVLSSNVFVGAGELPQYVNYTNNVINSQVAGSAFMYGITVCGEGNVIENNTLNNFKGNGIVNQFGATSTKNVYRNNTITGGGSMAVGTNSIVENNNIAATVTITAGCTATGNTVNGLTISGANAVVKENTVNGAVTISGANVVFENNTVNGAVTISGANVVFENNTVTGTVTVNSNGNTITGNNITSTAAYAVTVNNARTDNTVTDNYLIANGKYGDVAVIYNVDNNNIVENNTPLATIEIEADNVWVGQSNIITVTVPNATGSVTIKVNDKEYTVELTDNVASQEFAAEDFVSGINTVTVTYKGAEYIEATNTTTFMVLDGVVTNDTFFEYFDENGILEDFVPENAVLTFKGEFSNLTSNVVINTPVTINGDGAILNDMAFSIFADDVTLNNMTLTAVSSVGDLIGIYGDGVTVSDMALIYIVGNEEAIAINAIGVEDVTIVNNSIFFVSHVDSDGRSASAINIESVTGALVDNNNVTASITGVDADYSRTGLYYQYGMMGVNNVNPIRIVGSEDVKFTNNNIDASLNDVKGYYPTVQAVLVVGSSDLFIDGNNFTMNDTFTPEGSPSYLYAFTFGIDDEVTVSNNNFYLETKGGVNGMGTAYALQIVSSTMDIIGNNITSISNGPNLGLYAVMDYNDFDNDFTLTIKDNNLNVTGYATGKSTSALVSGMEIGAGEDYISGNTIHVYNKAGYVEGANVYGISYVQNVYTPTFEIEDNEIYVEDGDYAISVQFSRAELTATDNYLVAHNRYGDKAVSTKASGAVVEDNTPEAIITIEAADIWAGDDNTITVTIPKAVGNVTISVNGKEESVELVDGVATLAVAADDLVIGENTVEVVYDDISYNYATNKTTFQVLNNVVTKDNFFYYFDEDGVLLEDIPYDELIFKGDFDDLGIDVITIPRTVEITGEDAVLNDIALAIKADNVAVSDITFIANEVKFTANNGAVIYVEASDVKLNNVKVDYTVPTDSDPYAIFAKSADGFELISSEIKFTGKSENTAVQHGLRIVDSNNVLIKGNVIDAILPARDVNWGGSGIDQDTVLAVGIQNGNNVTFTQNKLTTTVSDVVAGNPTIGTIMVHGTTDLEISYNNISQTDLIHTGTVYNSAVDLYSFTGVVEYNNILVNTTTGRAGFGAAYAIQMNGPYTVAVNYNNLTAISKGPSAGIMTANWYGAGDLTATFNNIDVTGSGDPGDWMTGLTSGIELQVNVAKVYNNTVYARSVDAYNDNYHIYGISNDQFAMNMELIEIKDNIVYSDGKYAITVNNAADSIVTGNYLMAHELSGDAAVEKANTIKDNYPTTIDLSASAENIKVGDVAVINISANKLFTGDVTVIVNGKEETVTLTNGIGSLTVQGLAANNYTVGVSFEGDKYFNAGEASTVFSVSKLETTLTIETTEEPVVEDDVTVTVTIPGATGKVTIVVDGNSTEVSLENGVAELIIEDITAGEHSVVAIYAGDSTHDGAIDVYNFEVEKAEDYEFELNITTPEVKVGESLDINVTLPEDATGHVVIFVDDEEVPYTESEDGIISINGLTAGDHEISVVYSDDKYGEQSIDFDVTVDKVEIEISAATEDINVDDDAVINVTLPTDATGNVKVVVLGHEVPATMISGKGNAVFEGLPEGTYTAKVIFDGDDKYLPGETEVVFTVNQVAINPDTAVSVDIPENTTTPIFSIDLPEDATGYLLVDVDGNKTFAAVENGKASIPLPNLQAGNYTAVVTYTGDEKYAPFTTTKDVSIKANVTADNIDIPDGEPTETPTFSISLPSDATGYFEVDVDGKKYVVPVENGTASISVPGLSEGNHNVTVIYSGDSKYPAISKDGTVNVHIPVYKITENKNIKMLYTAKSPYKVLVTKDGKAVGAGESVAIKFNGKTYTVKTDKNGYATLKIPNVKPKKATYPITATYKGVTVKNTVKVNSIIKAKNKKVKKSKKVTKVKVSLKKVNGKYLKAKKIKIKFRGKTYKVKTNKKGVATWKVKKSMLKKLKVGKKYKYKVTYGKNTVTKKLTIRR